VSSEVINEPAYLCNLYNFVAGLMEIKPVDLLCVPVALDMLHMTLTLKLAAVLWFVDHIFCQA
jgi:hypothetical protein